MASKNGGAAAAPARDGKRPSADFPKHTLEATLKVARAIEDKNAGNPLPPMDVALAIEMSPGSSSFRDLLSSSIKYGLTAGSFNQPKVSLEKNGRDIVAPLDAETRKRSLVTAAFQPDLFRRVYDHYKGKKIPDGEFLAHTLVREFGVPRDFVQKAIEVFTANVMTLGLVKDGPTGQWLSADASGASEIPKVEAPTPIDADNQDMTVASPKPVQSVPAQTGDAIAQRVVRNSIFIGHGKNKVPLQQLEKILTEYKLPIKTAVDEANRFRPISQKVADTMQECGAAILIFTADEEFSDAEGRTVYRPSENVIYELGAASVLYGSRIIIFRDSRVELASNFKDIGYITFEGNDLAARMTELFRELISFGLIKISVA